MRGCVGSGADGRPRVEEGAPGGAPRGVLQEPVSQVGPQLAEFLQRTHGRKFCYPSFLPSPSLLPVGRGQGWANWTSYAQRAGARVSVGREKDARARVLEGWLEEQGLGPPRPPQCRAWGHRAARPAGWHRGARIGAAEPAPWPVPGTLSSALGGGLTKAQ